jgi:hypothetical protein
MQEARELRRLQQPELALSELLLSFATLLVPFLLGLFFFSKWMYRDIQVRWGTAFASQVLFAATLAVAFQMHVLLLLHVAGFIRAVLMARVWYFDFVAFVVLLKALVPLLLFYSLARAPSRPAWAQLALAGGLELLWVAANFSEDATLEGEVEKVGFIGVASMALLSGWGAVSGPYNYGPWFQRAYSDEEIESADVRLQSVLDMVGEHKAGMLLKQQQQQQQQQHRRAKNGSHAWRLPWTSWVWRAQSGEREKCLALEALANELFLERVEMRQAKSQAMFAQTWLGKSYAAAGYVFAAYCVFRVGAAVWTLAVPRSPNDPDAVTRVITLFFFTGSLETRRLLAQVVSFCLVGVMVVNSFRGLLLTLGKMFHQVGAFDSTAVSLALTEVMGHYLLSSIVLLNLTLPPEYRFGAFQRFAHFRRWFEILFLFAAVASTALIAVSDRAKKSRTEFYGLSAAAAASGHVLAAHEKLV